MCLVFSSGVGLSHLIWSANAQFSAKSSQPRIEQKNSRNWDAASRAGNLRTTHPIGPRTTAGIVRTWEDVGVVPWTIKRFYMEPNMWQWRRPTTRKGQINVRTETIRTTAVVIQFLCLSCIPSCYSWKSVKSFELSKVNLHLVYVHVFSFSFVRTHCVWWCSNSAMFIIVLVFLPSSSFLQFPPPPPQCRRLASPAIWWLAPPPVSLLFCLYVRPSS